MGKLCHSHVVCVSDIRHYDNRVAMFDNPYTLIHNCKIFLTYFFQKIYLVLFNWKIAFAAKSEIML